MDYWAGILLVSGEDDLRQNENLLGKRFSDLTADGDKFLATCSNGIFSLLDCYSDVIQVSDQPFKAISSGKDFVSAVRDNGTLYSWGTAGDSGQLGQGPQHRKIFEPLEIKYKAPFQSISCGESHTIAVDSDGFAHAWGDNSERQLNIYTKSQSAMRISNAMVEELVFNPRIIPWSMKVKVQKISCGKRFSMAISTNGKVFSWGAGECGQLGTGRCTMRDLPMEVSFPEGSTNIKAVSCGDGHCLAIDSNNRLLSWGLNQRGQLGLSDFQTRQTPNLIPSDVSFAKVYTFEHCSAAIDCDGQLWTWGSTSHDRLMHYQLTKESPIDEAPDVPYVPPAKRDVLHGISTPTMVSLPGTQGLKFEQFAFSKTRSAVLVRTKLLSVSPNKGPKRSFSKLLIHGYGLWNSSNIIVKFTSNAYSIYNPPRAVMGKLQDPFTIVCKPPKFSEVGTYTVSISLDGGELFLPETFEVNIYKEVSIAQQFPPILDLRSPFIEKLTLKIHGSRNLLSGQSDESSHSHTGAEQGIAVKASLYRINDNGTNSLVKEFPFRGQVVSEGLFAAGIAEEASRPATSQSESAMHTSKSAESEFVVECRDIRIPIDEELPLGLYEMICAISFNNQDYSGGSVTSTTKQQHHHEGNTSTICHAFQAMEAIPNCYANSELENLRTQVQARVQAYLKDMADAGFSVPGFHGGAGSSLGSESSSINGQDMNPIDHIPMDQIYGELRNFDRKIIIKARSLFPQSKLPKGAHIKARIDSVKVVPVELANNPSSAALSEVHVISDGIHDSLDPLLVYMDTSDTAHFTMTSAFLKLLDDYLESSVQTPIDRSKQLVTLQWHFYLESAALAAATAGSATDPPSGAAMVLLCEDSLPILLYPAFPLAASPLALRRHPLPVAEEAEQSLVSNRTISLTCRNLVFQPNTAIVRIHYTGAKNKDRDVIQLDQKKLHFEEIIEKLSRHEEEREATEADTEQSTEKYEEEEFIKGYRVEFELPEYAALQKKWANVLTNAEGGLEELSTIQLSLSLDGTVLPQEANWASLGFYSDLAKYSLQTAVPKGGFTPNSAISLQLDADCPVLPITVRLRGSDEQKAVSIAAQLVTQANSKPVISFSLPDAAGISSNPPYMQGKEKLYFVDISADNGISFDLAAQPQIQLK